MRILLIEDNRQLSSWLARTFRQNKYTVDCVYAGDDADHVLRTESYAVVILDLALPEIDGFEILRRLRASGADVYLAKPFDIGELEARIRVQLRRASAHRDPLVRCGALMFDSNSRQFSCDGNELVLTAREHAVLEALILRAGSTVSKSALTTTVFGLDDVPTRARSRSISIAYARKSRIAERRS